jgi:hypothetical protein
VRHQFVYWDLRPAVSCGLTLAHLHCSLVCIGLATVEHLIDTRAREFEAMQLVVRELRFDALKSL